MDNKNSSEYCKQKKEYKENLLIGIAYGIIPHIGCIMFIGGAVFGVTILTHLFKPILMNRYLFHYLILISVGLATLSSFFYLRKNKFLSWKGIKRKRKYLLTMYIFTIGINLMLFFFIFPYIANMTGVVSATEIIGTSVLRISVDIPCPGHAL